MMKKLVSYYNVRDCLINARTNNIAGLLNERNWKLCNANDNNNSYIEMKKTQKDPDSVVIV